MKSRGEALRNYVARRFLLMIPTFLFYMAFEAYHTASKRQKGEIVDEFSSIVPMQNHTSGFPVVPILLIVIGIVFLLVNLDLVRLYQVLRYWPVFLIALGVYLLYARVSRPERRSELPLWPEPAASARCAARGAARDEGGGAGGSQPAGDEPRARATSLAAR